MLDIKFVRENPELVKENIRKKFQNAKLPLVDEVIALDSERREAINEGEALKAERNKLSKANAPLFGQLKKCTDEAKKAELQAQIDANNAAVKASAERTAQMEAKKENAEAALNKIMLVIPQIIDPAVPIGKDDSCNVEVERFGEPKVPDFEIPYHTDIMERFDGIDMDAAGRVAGNGFYYLLGDIARLHEAVLAYGRDFFYEDTKYSPHSPYSASKASSDHFVRAFHDTYGMPTIVTNCSNNYGPYQFPEKLIPLFINNIRHRKPLPVYGKGENVRDWLYVEDHARAIDLIFHKGKVADTYNIGGFNEWKNIDLIKVVIKTVDRLLGRPEGADMDLITFVTDRAGHDMRYAIDSTKIQKELGWEPSLQFEEGIEKTVRWYLDNQAWMDNITSGEYEKYYEDMYGNR